MSATCKTCRHFDGPRSEIALASVEGNASRLGSCSRWYVGYGVRMEDVKDNEVLVEDDEGWAMLMGPDFGCVLHEIRAASSALGGGE